MAQRIGLKRMALIANTTIISTALAANLAVPSASAQQVLHDPNGVWTELSAWPAPPAFQGNPFASGGIGNEVYDGVFEPLMNFTRPNDIYYPRLAVSWDFSNPKETIVHLRHGVKWNDGAPFTSKDVWGYYILNWGSELTRYVSAIETPDPYTVVYKWLTPKLGLQYKKFFVAEDGMQIPYHLAKKWIDEDAAIFKTLKPDTNPSQLLNTNLQNPFGLFVTAQAGQKFGQIWQDFLKNDEPKRPIGTGPYVVTNVTSTDLYMQKNPLYYWKNNIHFQTVHLMNVPDLNQQYALLKAGKLDWVDSTPSKDILTSILAANPNLVHYIYPDAGSMGIMFNEKHQPFQNETFRKALIYAMDRNQIREVANYYGINTPYAGTGIVQSQVTKWLPQSELGKLTQYTYDPQKAAQLLESIGWKKGSDGIWRDANGKSYNFTIAVPNFFQQAISSAEIIAEQLTAFGLPTQMKEEDGSVYWTNAQQKQTFDMSWDWTDIYWGLNDPWESMINAYWWHNWLQAGLPRGTDGNALVVAKGIDGKAYNVSQLLHKMPFMSQADFKHAVEQIAYITNQNPFFVDLYQSAGGSWMNSADIKGLPWQSEWTKYNRNMPMPPTNLLQKIVETNAYWTGAQRWVSGDYSPN